jgi:hypothetical protein
MKDTLFKYSLHEMLMPNVDGRVLGIIALVVIFVLIFCIGGLIVAYDSDDDKSVLKGFSIAIGVDVLFSLSFFVNIFIALGIVAFCFLGRLDRARK